MLEFGGKSPRKGGKLNGWSGGAKATSRIDLCSSRIGLRLFPHWLKALAAWTVRSDRVDQRPWPVRGTFHGSFRSNLRVGSACFLTELSKRRSEGVVRVSRRVRLAVCVIMCATHDRIQAARVN